MNGRVTVWRSRHNPLVRGSDLAEAWVALALGALAFAGAPAAGVASAAAFEDSLLDQGQERHAASAVLLESPKRPPAVHPELPEAPPQAVVRWIASDGTPRSGRVVVAAGLTAGSTVTVWLDALGRPSGTPVTRADAAAQSRVVGAAVACGVAMLAISLRRVARAAFAYHRALCWEREWARVGPLWSGPLTP